MVENIITIAAIATIIGVIFAIWQHWNKKKEEDKKGKPPTASFPVNSISLTPRGQEPSPRVSPESESPWNVPFRRNPNFTGREGEMMRLVKMLQQGSQTVIGQAIKGMGGVGKTQLAVEYCHLYKDKYPGGILWAGGGRDILAEYGKLADMLGLDLPIEMEDSEKCRKVQQRLQQRPDKTLLILDNLDQEKAYEDIHHYLPTIGDCRILITTRLKSLGDGAGLSLDILPDNDALELLITESGRDGEDKETAQNICLMLGNLPLAIEVAGKYLNKMGVITFEEYYDKLTESGLHPSLLDGRILPNTDHKASIKATLTIHKDLMDDSRIMKILCAVICFAPDSINPEMLASVCGMDWEKDKEGVWELITTLDNYSLLEIQKDNRLSLHRLMREALAARLPDENKSRAQRDYVTEWEKWSPICNDVTKLKVVAPEVPHLIKAAKLADKLDIWPQSFELTIRLGNYYGNLGRYREKLKWLEPLESRLKDKHSQDKSRLALLFNNLGETYRPLGEYNRATGCYEQSLPLTKEAYGEKHPEVATRLNNLGAAWNSLGKYDKAIGFYEQALSIDRETYGERHPNVAIRLNNLGAAWDSLGEYDKAIKFYEQALSIDREAYDERHPKVAIRLNNLGESWRAKGEYDKAREYYQQAYSIFLEFLGEDHPSTKVTKDNMAALPG